MLLSWTPAEEQTGVYIACFVAMDMHSTPSTPYCLPLIASAENMEVCTCNTIDFSYNVVGSTVKGGK